MSAGDLETAMAAHRQGRLDEAQAVYRALTESDPDHPEPWHLLGVIQLQKGDAAGALPLFDEALRRDARHVKCRANRGAALYQLDRYEDAERELREALRLDPANVEARYNLGTVLMKLEREDDAMAAFAAVLESVPTHPKALINTGILHARCNRNREAEPYFVKALEQTPDDPAALINFARVCERLNRMEDARDTLARLAERTPDDPVVNFYAAKLDLRDKNPDAALARLDKVIGRCDDAVIAIDALYVQAQALLAAGHDDAAFAAFVDANAAESRAYVGRKLFPEQYRARVAAAHARLDRGPIAPAPGGVAPDGERGPVFFVGFPRSGTTLFEQMLAMHGDVVTTNEDSPLDRLRTQVDRTRPYGALDVAEVERLRAAFWDDAQRTTGGLAGRLLVDKMPLNFEHLDLAARLFPNAKVVVALRDPRDACLSCFMQHFTQSHAMANFLDLQSTADLYARVMDLWLRQRDMLPVPWVEFRYEDLVAEPAATIGPVLDCMGIDWTEDMLAFHEKAHEGHVITPSYSQVGEKLNTRAAGRWRKFERQLAPILPGLAPYVEAFGYED